MRLLQIVLPLSLAACAALAGCRSDAPPRNAAQMLQSADPDTREDAAKDLASDDGPTPDMVPMLIAALEREQNSDVYAALLIALGKSGAPEAKPYLEVNTHNKNKGVRRGAEKGLEYWARKNPNGVPPPGVARSRDVCKAPGLVTKSATVGP